MLTSHKFIKLFEAENLNFAVYCMINTHINKFFKTLSLKVSYTSFLIAGIHCICQMIAKYTFLERSLHWLPISNKIISISTTSQKVWGLKYEIYRSECIFA